MALNSQTELELLREAAIRKRQNLEQEVRDLFHPAPKNSLEEGPPIASPFSRTKLMSLIDEARNHPMVSSAVGVAIAALSAFAASRGLPVGKKHRSIIPFLARKIRPQKKSMMGGAIREQLMNAALPIGMAIVTKGLNTFLQGKNSRPSWPDSPSRSTH